MNQTTRKKMSKQEENKVEKKQATKTVEVLKLAIHNGFNVLLTGRHGVGKTAIVRQALEELGLVWKYFSASTIDPWIDLVGIPYKGESGLMELLRPANLDFENIEVMFLDEYNRAPKKVRNAVMELIQFKSINGKKFPKLKAVIAAINPDDDEEMAYDVEKLDPAQIDRFHMTLPVKNAPCPYFFKNKYGSTGSLACGWWHNQNAKVRDIISPRRLEAGVMVFLANLDPQHVFDAKMVSIQEFTEALSRRDPVDILEEALSFTDIQKRELFADNNQFRHVENKLFATSGFIKGLSQFVPEAIIMKHLGKSTGTKFITYVSKNPGEYEKLIPILLSNESSYSGLVIDSFKAYQRSHGTTSGPASLARTVMIDGVKTKVDKMVVCFSGGLSSFTRVKATELLEAYGAKVISTPNFTLTHLVSTKTNSIKMDKAKKMKAMIISERTFMKMVQELDAGVKVY